MFAPPVAKSKAKAASNNKASLQRSAAVGHRFGDGAVAQTQLLQRSISNQAMLGLLAQRAAGEPGSPENAARLPGVLQAKLKVGAVNDPLEHEADRVAEQVMCMPAPEIVLTSGPPQASPLIANQQDEIDAALIALQDPAVIPAGGWLVLGRVLEADGTPPHGGQIDFEGGGDIAGKLLPSIGILADGQVRFALSAAAVAEITRQGEVSVRVVANVGGRRAEDVAPARIVADGLHQFDLVLPAPAGTERPGPAYRQPP